MPKPRNELPETFELAITKVIPLIFFKPFPLMGRVAPLVTFSDEAASTSKEQFLKLEQTYKQYLDESNSSQREAYQKSIKALCLEFGKWLSSPACSQARFQELKLALTNYSKLALIGGGASGLMLAAGIATILLFLSGATPLFIVAGLSALLIGSLGLLVYGVRALIISKKLSSLDKNFDILAFSSRLIDASKEGVQKPVLRERIIDHEETPDTVSAPSSPRVGNDPEMVDNKEARHSSSAPSSPRDGKGCV